MLLVPLPASFSVTSRSAARVRFCSQRHSRIPRCIPEMCTSGSDRATSRGDGSRASGSVHSHPDACTGQSPKDGDRDCHRLLRLRVGHPLHQSCCFPTAHVHLTQPFLRRGKQPHTHTLGIPRSRRVFHGIIPLGPAGKGCVGAAQCPLQGNGLFVCFTK